MNKLSIFLLSLVVVLLTSSCATIVSGSKQTIHFNSTPQGAVVSINGNDVGETPFVTKLKRNKEYLVEISLPGYKPYRATIEKGFNSWVIGNVFFGGFIGLGIDFISGAVYKLSPDDVNAYFSHKNTVASVNGNNIYVTTILTPLPTQEKIGQLERL